MVRGRWFGGEMSEKKVLVSKAFVEAALKMYRTLGAINEICAPGYIEKITNEAMDIFDAAKGEGK